MASNVILRETRPHLAPGFIDLLRRQTNPKMRKDAITVLTRLAGIVLRPQFVDEPKKLPSPFGRESPNGIQYRLLQCHLTIIIIIERVRRKEKNERRPHATVNYMSVYEERREELEKHEFMMGKSRGRLAVTLDVLTDALVLVGQHGVYCQSARTPGKPAMDVQ